MEPLFSSQSFCNEFSINFNPFLFCLVQQYVHVSRASFQPLDRPLPRLVCAYIRGIKDRLVNSVPWYVYRSIGLPRTPNLLKVRITLLILLFTLIIREFLHPVNFKDKDAYLKSFGISRGNSYIPCL